MTWTHEHAATLDAAPSIVFNALTEPTQLSRWFAEHLDIGAAVDAPFRFWGKHTLDTPTADHATQRIVRWVPANALAYSWTIGGVDTEVSITLTAESPTTEGGDHGADASTTTTRTSGPAERTKLLLRHRVASALPYPRERELIDDHWRLVCGNLAMHLSGGGVVLPDFSDPTPEVRQVLMIDAPRDVVFRTLITPALVNQWFGTKVAVVEPRVGGLYETGWRYTIDGRDVVGGPTHIIEYVENERLVLDWPDWRGDMTVSGQTICFSLESVGTQTRLTFVHAGFGRTTDLSDYPFGWSEFLGNLTEVATARR